MILRRQPYAAGQCGQYCISMITGYEPGFILSMMGKKLNTHRDDLISILEEFGYHTSGKMEAFTKFPKGGIVAILRIKFDDGGYHWAVFDKFAVLDPLGMCCSLEEYQQRIKGKITSFLKVWQES